MDTMIEATQKWLNETYTGKTGWEPVPEDGKTGWTTVYALLYAFQIENGSTTPSTNIGPGLSANYRKLVCYMKMQMQNLIIL